MSSTLTEDLTWQLGDTGTILNADLATGVFFVDVDTVTGFDSAPIRQTQRDHEGVDGGFMDAEFEKGRDVSIIGTLYFNGANLMESLDTLKAEWAPSTTLIKLYFLSEDVGIRYLKVKPLGVTYDLNALLRVGQCPVKFSAYAEDPRFYDETETSATLPIASFIFNGFSFNFGFNLSFGGTTGASGDSIVTIGGNRPAPWVGTITGPLLNPVITNLDTSDVMGFVIDLPAATTLVFDTYYKTVRLNGTASRRNALVRPGWFDLSPGVNNIRFQAESGSGSMFLSSHSAWR